MLETISNFICSLIMCSTGFIIINNIIKSDEKLLTKRNVFLVLLLSIVQLFIHNSAYNINTTILIFSINIIIYKIIFRITFEEIIVFCGIYTIILFFSDVIIAVALSLIYTMEQIRTDPIISISSNIIIGLISYFIVRTKIISSKINSFVKFTKRNKRIINIIFISLLILCLIFLGYNITKIQINNVEYIVNFITMIILAVISYIFINDKINYYQLNDEYDTLFGYVQNFEEWIEKEQLNRHEYKNQIAILRSLTKEKELINKIDELLEDNINIKNEQVYKLKELPKGGLKGLMYYKVAIAQKNKLNIDVDVSLNKTKTLNKLDELEMKTLCNLVGIYFDNAIEASKETKKKLLVLEIYNIKNTIKIIISNSFINRDIDRRNEKGFTTKGKGHGNGLHYAKNILNKNTWIESSQEIIDDLYVQTLEIKKD